MHLGKDKCNKKLTKKCYKNFFGCFFSGANNVQMVPKYIWIGHWVGWYKTFFKFLVLLIEFTLQKYTFLKGCVRIWVTNVQISQCTTHKPCYIYQGMAFSKKLKFNFIMKKSDLNFNMYLYIQNYPFLLMTGLSCTTIQLWWPLLNTNRGII